MTMATSKKHLSQSRRALLELMQRIRFGRIDNLVVEDGEPVLQPLPHVVREVKFGNRRSSSADVTSDDFLLKTQIVQFFEQLDELQTGTIRTLEVQDGLPFRMSMDDAVR